jgi:hypothetical protein
MRVLRQNNLQSSRSRSMGLVAARCVVMVVLFSALQALTACHSASTPEAQIRELINRGEKAAEERSVSGLTDLLAADFRDGTGNSSVEIGRYLRGFFIANQKVRLLTRIDSIDVTGPDTATAKVSVASATQSGEGSLTGLGADFRTFDLSLIRESGDWKVRFAKWER